MADEEESDRSLFKTAIRILVVFLVGFSIVGSAVLIQTEGLTIDTATDVFVNLYIAFLVFYGVFFDKIQSRTFRAALYAGVVIWGGTDLLTGDDTILSYVLIVGGGALLTRELFLKYD